MMPVSETGENCDEEITLKVNQSLTIHPWAVWKWLGKQGGTFDVGTFNRSGIQLLMPVVAAMTAFALLSVFWLILCKSGLS